MSTKKEKNGTFDKSIVIPNLTLLVSAVISVSIPNGWLQILFIICYTASVFFFSEGKEINNAKKYRLFLAAAAAVIFIASGLYYDMSLKDCISQMTAVFNIGDEDQTDGMKVNRKELETQLTQLNENYKDHLKELETYLERSLDHRLEVPLDSLVHDKELYRQYKSREDPQEIKQVLEEIAEFKKEQKDTDLETNVKRIELMYKMRLSSRLFYYINVIKAFEDFGIDCEAFEIDEYRLALWDMQYIFSIYQMRKSLDNKEDNESYETLELFFQDGLDEYDDQLNYGNWNKTFTNETNKEVKHQLDQGALYCYKKIYRNFQTDSKG